MFQPVIKWSGSKRSQAEDIISLFPKQIDTYYEPFCGGCSVLRQLIENKNCVKRYICSDLNRDLINLWERIKKNPNEVYGHYSALWNKLNEDDDINRKRDFFETIRKRYNIERNPDDFMFIMRTTTNGMPRYNKKGEFNNSFHFSRKGVNPLRLKDIINEWNSILNSNHVIFKCCDFLEIHPEKNDLIYLDPPYFNTKGMYFGNFDENRLFEFLRTLPCKYVMSYDGISGKDDHTYGVPKELYKRHMYLNSGRSSFKRIKIKKTETVYESLYLNF